MEAVLIFIRDGWAINTIRKHPSEGQGAATLHKGHLAPGSFPYLTHAALCKKTSPANAASIGGVALLLGHLLFPMHPNLLFLMHPDGILMFYA